MPAEFATTSPAHPGHDLTRGTEAETKHTPGPLFVRPGIENALTKGHVVTTADRRQIVAECPRMADATLYAASPDLLDACKLARAELLKVVPPGASFDTPDVSTLLLVSVTTALGAVIARAEGRQS